MTENEYIERIYDAWPDEDGATDSALLALADEAVHAHPSSAELWVMRGDLLVLADRGRDARDSYEASLSLAPCDVETLESLAYLLDVSFGDVSGAEACFRRAIDFGGSPDAYAGLARLLTESDRKSEAITLLDADACPFVHESQVIRMKAEILEGLWDK